MCDTFVALGNSTGDGSVLFAKNSDRQPNEPHIMIRVPAKTRGERTVRLTYIEIPQVGSTYEVLLLKPSWIWGAEMGCNEHGLTIGNEAVFTKEKYGPPALTGMDMVRLALERCRTSDEALELMIELLTRYGQGGNCGYEKPFTYHNSFLIADPLSAWVFETAGAYWAARKVADAYAISNRLTIGRRFDRAHPDLISHAARKGWCGNESDFSFRDAYGDPLFSFVSGSGYRLETARFSLEKAKGGITIDALKRILRSHDGPMQGREFSRASVRSVCMHAGGVVGDHTTGSFVARLTAGRREFRVTGASTPCLAVFKPAVLSDGIPFFTEDEKDAAVSYWTYRERLHRLVLSGAVDTGRYLESRNRLESRFEELFGSSGPVSGEPADPVAVSRQAFEEEEALVRQTVESADGTRTRIGGSVVFRRFWKERNRKLELRSVP